MASAIKTFNAEIFNKPREAQNFFKANEAVEAICKKENVAQGNEPACTLPFRISACVWRMFSLFASCFCCENLSRYSVVRALHAQSQAERLNCKKRFGPRLLAHSVNTYIQNRKDIYLHSPIYSSLLQKDVHLFNGKGLCRGMSVWFFCLYFKTKQYVRHPTEHIRQVTQQFSQGAPEQAVALDRIEVTPKDFPKEFNLNIRITPYEEINPHLLSEEFDKLGSGEYIIYSSNHAFDFIKRKTYAYLFDPNYGCFFIDKKSPESLQKVLSLSLASHEPRSKIIIDKVCHL